MTQEITKPIIQTKTGQAARQTAFEALRAIDRGAFADVVLDRQLNQSQLSAQDKGLVTELVYGTVRRRRTLDALIDQFGKREASQATRRAATDFTAGVLPAALPDPCA